MIMELLCTQENDNRNKIALYILYIVTSSIFGHFKSRRELLYSLGNIVHNNDAFFHYIPSWVRKYNTEYYVRSYVYRLERCRARVQCIYILYYMYINGAVLQIWLQFADCKYRYYYYYCRRHLNLLSVHYRQ